MAGIVKQEIARPPRGLPQHVGGRVALTFVAVVLGPASSCGGSFVLARPGGPTRDPGSRLEHGGRAFLRLRSGGGGGQLPPKGLSRSPALLSGDIKAFYDQMKATPVPEGSWLILQDLEGQFANTLRPSAPRCRSTPPSPTTRSRSPAFATGAGRSRGGNSAR